MNAIDYLKLKAAGKIKIESAKRGIVKATFITYDAVGTESEKIEMFDVEALYNQRLQHRKTMADMVERYAAMKKELDVLQELIADTEAMVPELPESL